MLHVLSVVGARPQFVKAAVVSRALRQCAGVRETLVHTGQHYDDNMSDVFFAELQIPSPDYNLAIGSGHHGEQTGRMLAAIEQVLLARTPNVVLVYGDTNSTLAAALAAAKLHIPVAHVEAGLRSFNRRMPEEINRVMTDHLSSFLFAPTTTAVRNLAAEGIPDDRIFDVGDVMYDVALRMGRSADSESQVLQSIGVDRGAYLLATIHRAENTDRPDILHTIMTALAELAAHHRVVMPIHPRTRSALGRAGDDAWANAPGLMLIEPVGYLDMIALERGASVIVTDSGGVQKEAYFHQVPCVTVRHETEWTELVDTGWNTLAPPTSSATIVDAVCRAMTAAKPAHGRLYGDGDSAERIVETLVARHSLASSGAGAI